MKYVLSILAFIVSLYGIFAFVLFDLSPSSWGEDVRLTFVLIVVCILPILSLAIEEYSKQ